MENVQKSKKQSIYKDLRVLEFFPLWLCILQQTQSDKFVQAQLLYCFLTLNYLLLFIPVFKVKNGVR